MSNAIAVQENSDLITFDDSKLDLIKRTIAPTATPDELELFLHQCRRTGLDPLAKQIYFQKFKGKMAIVTGIDGYRLIATRTKLYAGNDEPRFDGRIAITDCEKWDRITHAPAKATMTVKRIVGGVACDFTATAYWEEFYPGGKRGTQWRKMPHVMLAKIAEAAALRKAFPADLSGIYTSEEMEQAQITTLPTPPRNVKIETGEIIDEQPIYEADAPPFVPDDFADEAEPEEARDGDAVINYLIQQARGKTNPASDGSLKYMRSSLKKVAKNADAKILLKVVYGLESSADATQGQASAIIDWIGSSAPDWEPSPVAVEEAAAVLNGEIAQAMK